MGGGGRGRRQFFGQKYVREKFKPSGERRFWESAPNLLCSGVENKQRGEGKKRVSSSTQIGRRPGKRGAHRLFKRDLHRGGGRGVASMMARKQRGGGGEKGGNLVAVRNQ